MTAETSHQPAVDVATKRADRQPTYAHRPRIPDALMGSAIAAVVAVTTVVMAFAGPVAAKGKGIHFTVKLTGASIGATQSVFKAHDSYFGSGAGVSSMTVNAAGNGGTDSETTYYGDAAAKSRSASRISWVWLRSPEQVTTWVEPAGPGASGPPTRTTARSTSRPACTRSH